MTPGAFNGKDAWIPGNTQEKLLTKPRVDDVWRDIRVEGGVEVTYEVGPFVEGAGAECWALFAPRPGRDEAADLGRILMPDDAWTWDEEAVGFWVLIQLQEAGVVFEARPIERRGRGPRSGRGAL